MRKPGVLYGWEPVVVENETDVAGRAGKTGGRGRGMKKCAWLIAVAVEGIAPLVSGGGKVESLTAPSPSPDAGRPDAAADDNGVHVMLTDASLWVTYTQDGEGNPLGAGIFALDITTGDMWYLTGGEVVELSAAGEWVRYSVEDFGHAQPRKISALAGVIMIAPDGTWTDYTGQLNGRVLGSSPTARATSGSSSGTTPPASTARTGCRNPASWTP